MKAMHLFAAGSLCCLLLPNLYAADNENAAIAHAAPPKLSAAQIAERNAVARGGLKAWRSIQTMTISGKMDAGRLKPEGGPTDARGGMNGMSGRRMDSRLARAVARAEFKQALENGEAKKDKAEGQMVQLPFVMELKRPRMQRVELQFQGQTAVQVYDGKNGWKVRPYLGHSDVQSFNAEELRQAADQQELDGPLIDYAAKGNKLEFEQVEAVEGRDAYKLKLTLKDGQVRHVWVDAQTFLEVKMDGSRRMDGKQRPMATYFRDYKTVDGLKIPFTVETRVEGVKDPHSIYVDKVALNAKLTDSRFAKPE